MCSFGISRGVHKLTQTPRAFKKFDMVSLIVNSIFLSNRIKISFDLHVHQSNCQFGLIFITMQKKITFNLLLFFVLYFYRDSYITNLGVQINHKFRIIKIIIIILIITSFNCINFHPIVSNHHNSEHSISFY
jgi:5,10-methylenetetrahydrofolate reductase